MPNLQTTLPTPCAVWWCVAYAKPESQFCTVHHVHPEMRTWTSPSGAGQREPWKRDAQIPR